jgi:hypothetical protein
VQVYKYKIPIDSSFFDGSDVVLSIDQGGTMTLTHDKTQLLIKPDLDDLASISFAPRRVPAMAWISVVEAAVLQNTDIASLIGALDADDPVIRANAKRALAERGDAAIPALGAALRGNYRTQVEVLSTLSKMQRDNLLKLSSDARNLIVQLAGSSDTNLRAGAESVFRAGLPR